MTHDILTKPVTELPRMATQILNIQSQRYMACGQRLYMVCDGY